MKSMQTNQNEQQINDEQIIEKINCLNNQTDPYITPENWPKIRRVPFLCMRAGLATSFNAQFIAQISINNIYGELSTYIIGFISQMMSANLDVDELEVSNLPDGFSGILDSSEIQSIFLNNRNYFPDITNVSKEDLLEIVKLIIKEYYNVLEPYYYLFSYDDINIQGQTFRSLHLEYNEKSNKLFIDYNRSRFNIFDQERRISSNLQTAVFDDRSLINCETIPNERILLFWLAFNVLIPSIDAEKTKLAQLLNTENDKLTPEQKAIKEKINDEQFQNDVIKAFFKSFKPWPNEGVTEITIDNIKDNMPDKNHIIFIIHALDENLTELEKQFKYIFLGQAQGLYKQYYKNKYGQEPPQELTQEQIQQIYKIKPKVRRMFSSRKFCWAKKIRDFFQILVNNNNNTDIICSNVYLTGLKKEIRKPTVTKLINTINAIDFPNTDVDLNSLNEDQKNVLSAFVDLCDLAIPNLSIEEKIEILNYTRKDENFFTEYVDNPKFINLKLDDGIKEFYSYLFSLEERYNINEGAIQNFKNAADPQKVNILSLLPDGFQETVRNFNLYQPPTQEEINNKLTECFKNAIIEIENEKIPFENWSYNRQICKITNGQYNKIEPKDILNSLNTESLNEYLNSKNRNVLYKIIKYNASKLNEKDNNYEILHNVLINDYLTQPEKEGIFNFLPPKEQINQIENCVYTESSDMWLFINSIAAGNQNDNFENEKYTPVFLGAFDKLKNTFVENPDSSFTKNVIKKFKDNEKNMNEKILPRFMYICNELKGSGFIKAVCEGKFNNNDYDSKDIAQKVIKKIKSYPKEKQIKMIRKLTSSPSLQNEIKQEIFIKYSQLPGNGFIKALASGKLELNQETAILFFQKICNLYATNPSKATRLKLKILNDSNTTAQFREFLNALDFTILVSTYSNLYLNTTLMMNCVNLIIDAAFSSCRYATGMLQLQRNTQQQETR